MSDTLAVLSQHGRRVYVASGKVHWRLFALHGINAFMLSVLVGGLLYLALMGGLYFMFLTPILLAALTGGITWQFVQ